MTEEETLRWGERYVAGGCEWWGDERDEKWACIQCGYAWGAKVEVGSPP